ncbi:alpha-amylase domain-containing protein [Halonatronum saccharophilum]|uniref:alpha-amylase domain-containing protein n=1 Tax=Halonatronum saccharophilum TaxID=150060 RepID=UPI00048949DD|nr:alpha-amylase domain-containing protein [Halonatronum saccharophilum]
MFKFNKAKVLFLVLILSLTVVLTGCFGSGDLFVVDSNLGDYNLSSVPEDLEEITVGFSEDLLEVEVVLEENGEQLEGLTIDIDGRDLRISNLELNEFSLYNLMVRARDESGNEFIERIEFITEENFVVENPNELMMQVFYWEMGQDPDRPEERDLWLLLEDKAEEIAEAGFTSLWLPPANKAFGGLEDVGYGTYDLWDLGEFDQQRANDPAGTIRTKYGTKYELEGALAAISAAGMDAYYDVIFNHRMGADTTERVRLSQSSPDKPGQEIEAWTYFDLEGRQKYYSRADQWKWDWTAFDAVDWDQASRSEGRFIFEGKSWDNTYGSDYLMGSDVDYSREDIRHEMNEWGEWIVNEIGFDGFRLDAIKHVDSDFTREWIEYVQQNTEQDVVFIAEAWENSDDSLAGYLEHVGHSDLTAFDFPLREAFANMRDGRLNLSDLENRGLVNREGYENRAVTFVDNHDTDRDGDEYGDAIYSHKYQAYTYILMHENGIPKVYWKDYYVEDMKEGLDKLIGARNRFAYGPGYAAENNSADNFAYVRKGSKEVEGSGLVMMINQGGSRRFTGESFEVTFSYEPGEAVESVSLAGEINGWDPSATPMVDENGDGVYEVTKELSAGEYAYKFVVNGDQWIEPEGAEKYVGDGHGGQNAVIVLGAAEEEQEVTEEFYTQKVNSSQPNTTFIDYTANVEGTVTTDADGYGEFKVRVSVEDGWSVWVPISSN